MPALLRNFAASWKRFARKIGDFQARLLLTVFYVFVVGPFALLIRRGDPMGMKRLSPRAWLPYSSRNGNPMERAGQQF